ncbi:hypothetical protein J3A83DRAFT_4053996, partial [Scleroderma citrinum]
RHLKMLKHAGQAHDSSGIESTCKGQCTLLCPVCLQPGKNLPMDWHHTTPEK